MPFRHSYGRPAPPSPSHAPDPEAFELVDIRPVRPPEGCAGRDWLVYQIAQGRNLITGYRRGEIGAATQDVQRIVVNLNERRVAGKNRPGPKPKAPAQAAAAPAAPAVEP
jgi:hypothetical protein